MILGMPWHFYVVVAATFGGLWLLDRTLKQRQQKQMDEAEAALPDKDVKLFGGPLNGKVEKVQEQLSYWIVPYMPEDPEEAQQIGQIGENILYAPNFAFYQQVGDPESYFYRRDLTMEEVKEYQTTGNLPEDVK